MIPSTLQVLLTLQLNKIYKQIAIWCTDHENHMTKSSYNNSLILKRFVFEFFDFFMHLFYVAFYNLDILALRKELITLFTVDEGRRILTETVIPYICRKINACKKKKENKQARLAAAG